MSQTPCFASYATDGSVARSNAPPSAFVIPGNGPCVQVAPLSVDVAKPTSVAPPSKKRPVWKAETTVDPAANVSGSTSAWCCPGVGLEYGSLLTCVRATAAATAAASTRATAVTPAVAYAPRALTRRASPIRGAIARRSVPDFPKLYVRGALTPVRDAEYRPIRHTSSFGTA